MSFGIAFALPAYDNPLSTGLNPFTQSGPTLDLLFTGLPAVDNTFVGSSLTLNFLTQQYQLPAQYSVWVADQGLTAKTFSQIITFTRAITATFVGSDGLVQTAAINAPRFEYNPSTLTPLGFLIEEARTNLLPESNGFNSTWTLTNAVINSNDPYPSPDAFSSSVLFIQPIAAGTTALSYSLTKAATATQYSQSIWINSEFGTALPAFNLSLDDGTTTNRGVAVFSISSVGAGALVSATSEGNFSGTSATITGYINNWYRITLTTTSNTATTVRFRCFYTATIASPIAYVWGAQLEVGAFPTSFIYTNGGAVTRAADLASINTLSPWFNSAQGTLFAQFEASANTFTAYVDISNGVTAQNSIHIDNDGGLMRSVYYSGSAPVATLSLGAIGTVGAVNKVATSYAVNNFRANRNGGSIVTDTAGALPVGLTQMNIGADPSGTAVNVINGHIQRITYYPRSMANYELQALTV
jgi:hypothetical protein